MKTAAILAFLSSLFAIAFYSDDIKQSLFPDSHYAMNDFLRENDAMNSRSHPSLADFMQSSRIEPFSKTESDGSKSTSTHHSQEKTSAAESNNGFDVTKGSLLGEQTFIFDPFQGDLEIQKKINSIYNQQLNNQFGDRHYAFLFKPGIYHLDVKVGYYTQVLGLGRIPDDVTIIGAIRTQDDPQTHPIDHGPGALNNFWRSVENISVIPTLGSLNKMGKGIPKDENVWAVSQAAPMRNVHVKQDKTLSSSGSLRLFDIGWSSGGFMANTKVDGHIEAGSQQQWLSRNSEWNLWQHGNWNIVDVGSKFVIPFTLPNPSHGHIPENAWPTYPFTSIPLSPIIAEKPTLILDDNHQFAVLVPDLNLNSSGVSWGSGSTIPISQFYVATPQDTAEKINDELQHGANILFTPGVYKLSKAIHVEHPNTILLGIGLPSLMPINGTPAIVISDVDGVKIGGLMIDAGPIASSTLVQVGETASKNNHSSNPSILYDIFCRVGGLSNEPSKAISCVIINSNDVIGDNFWLWRADHGVVADAVGWTLNTADHGLIVNGNQVTIYGLAVEHFQKTQTIWNGESGRVYFYQCELPYDPPNQKSWKNGAIDGYAGYKVADGVQAHEAWGLGIYSYFRDASDIFLENAIEAPDEPGIKLHHMVTVWLNGNANGSLSGIRHILNGKGNPVISTVEKGTSISALD